MILPILATKVFIPSIDHDYPLKKEAMVKILTFLLLFLPLSIFAQKKTSSDVVYSFRTKTGKTMSLTLDASNKQLIYRYGKPNKVELEFPEKPEGSLSQFKYSFYLRGGGAANEAMDMNHITFTNKEYKYVIYDETAQGKRSVGIIEINQDTKKKTKSIGIPSSVKGSLIDFRTNKLIEIVEESF